MVIHGNNQNILCALTYLWKLLIKYNMDFVIILWLFYKVNVLWNANNLLDCECVVGINVYINI